MIPKIIHYCWINDNPVPRQFRIYIEGWKKIMPEYEFILWNCDNFDINSSVWVKEALESGYYAFAADYIRLYALYNYGGIYLDTDVEVLKSFNDLLDREFIMGYESTQSVEVGILGANVRAEWVYNCMNYYSDKRFINPDGTYNIRPMPFILYDVISVLHTGYLKSILPPEYLTAKSLATLKTSVTDNTYSVHHFAASWTTKSHKFKRKVKFLLGPGITAFIVKLKSKVRSF